MDTFLQVALLVFIIMVAFAVIIWIGLGKNPIDAEVAARVWSMDTVILVLFYNLPYNALALDFLSGIIVEIDILF